MTTARDRKRAALGEYLHTEGIPATFFVIGQLAERAPELLKSLRSWGHCVGSHTYRHAGLFDLAMSGGDVVDEIARADAVLRPYVAGPVLLRPPYGSWRRKSRLDGPEDWPSSLVAERLRASGRFADYAGPVMWDIVAEDWECWRRGDSVECCAEAHFRAIERVGGGIVLMHDGSEDAQQRSLNKTGSMTMALVPRLKACGYRFVLLDAIPEVAAAMLR